MTGNIYQRWGKHVSTKLISSFGITKKQLQKSLISLSLSSYKRFSIYPKKNITSGTSCASCIIFLIHILLATLLHHKTFFEVTNWKALLHAALDYTLLLLLFKSATLFFFKLYVKVFQYLFSTLFGNGGFVQQEVLH